MKKLSFAVLVFVLIATTTVCTAEKTMQSPSLLVKVLLLPKIEIGEMDGDLPGEAQCYYEQYLMDAGEYDMYCLILHQRVRIHSAVCCTALALR